MMDQIYSFAVGLAAFGVYVVVFLVFMRLRPRAGWFGAQVAIGALIHLLSTGLCLYLWSDGFLYWYALGLFAVAWFFFFTLSTAIYVSISARIVRIIDQSPDRTLPIEELYNRCIHKPFKERANFLVHTGLAQQGTFGFIITSQGLKNASWIVSMRKFWGMDGAGLYSSNPSVEK